MVESRSTLKGGEEYITTIDNMVVVLPELGREDAIHIFLYSLKPIFKGLVK